MQGGRHIPWDESNGTQGHESIDAVDATKTGHRRRTRTQATCNVVASETDIGRVEYLLANPTLTDVRWRKTKRGDVREIRYIDPSRIKPRQGE